MMEMQQSCGRLGSNKKRKFIDDLDIRTDSKNRQKCLKPCHDNSSSDVAYSPDISCSSDSNVSHCDLTENGHSTLFCGRDVMRENGDVFSTHRSSVVKNEDTDFTRFVSSNQVDRVLSPSMWESLETRNYDSLMNRFDDEFSKYDTALIRHSCVGNNSNSYTYSNHDVPSLSNATLAETKGKVSSEIIIPLKEDDESTENHRAVSERDQGICIDGPTSVPLIPDKFYVALDCEMVGVGVKGTRSALARCSIVDYDGRVIFDRYIKPNEPVTDFRTRWSGIFPHHMRFADPEDVALLEIHKHIENRIVIGHAVFNDFRVVRKYPPYNMVRDTAQCKQLVTMAGLEGQGNGLKKLALALLDKKIQGKKHGHDSVEDAITALELFKLVRSKWEPELFTKWKRKGLSETELLTVMQEQERKIHEDEDYLSDKYWPSDVSV